MVSWFYFRFIAYTYIVVFHYGFGGRISIDNYSEITQVVNFLLISLLGLNIYWFILLTRMGYRLAFNGQKVDLQNVVTKKDIK